MSLTLNLHTTPPPTSHFLIDSKFYNDIHGALHEMREHAGSTAGVPADAARKLRELVHAAVDHTLQHLAGTVVAALVLPCGVDWDDEDAVMDGQQDCGVPCAVLVWLWWRPQTRRDTGHW